MVDSRTNTFKCRAKKREKWGTYVKAYICHPTLSKNRDLILVQESLGHADINTSRIYTHFDKQRLDQTTDIF